MEMSGEQQIAAPRETVWEALNDPDVLKQCIPGCQHIEKSGDNAFDAKVKAKVGPVNATFSGRVTLSNLNPPESYTISGEGTGGAAGFAKGSADVKLEDQGESTLLKYDVDAQVGGKLAQLGQRLIKSTANKYATQFFNKFTEVVGKPEAAEAEGAAPAGETAAAAESAAATAATSPTAEQAPAESPTQAASAEQARPSAQTGPTAGTPTQQAGRGLSPKVWIGGVIAIVIILLLIFAL